MAGNVWLIFLAELWIAGVMGYMALSLMRSPSPSTASAGGDAVLLDLAFGLSAVASVALMLHALSIVAGVSL